MTDGHANKNRKEGHKPADKSDTDIQRSELASREMGDNKIQGNDQANVRNQRHAVPDVKQEADDVIESFEKLDKHVRAKRDLGKGNA